MAVPGVQRAFMANLAQGKRTSPKHLHCVIKQLAGELRTLDIHLNDDAALAACQVRDRLPMIRGLLNHIDTWTAVVNDCEPHEVPTKGARL